jgi:chaperonin GroES
VKRFLLPDISAHCHHFPPNLSTYDNACKFDFFITNGTIVAVQGAKPILLLKTKNKSMADNNLNITPLHDRVIVKPAAAEEKTAGGIIIPDTAKEKPQKGLVVAAGPGKKDEPVTVKVGDTVLYGKYAGTEISVEGGEYLIMRESDILAIV